MHMVMSDVFSNLGDFFTQLFSSISSGIVFFGGPLDMVLNLVDIVVTTLVIYYILRLMADTRAWQLLRGIILILTLTLLVELLGLETIGYILNNSISVLAIAFVVVFQPELRRALERLGRASGLGLWAARDVELDRVVNAIVSACRRLSERRHGALIVIERDTGLQDYVETGVVVDAVVADELLQTIFFPKTALHDGAVIIRGDRIVAAACVLPLAESLVSDSHLGTRHRAAVGITQQTDALAVVVSEETGTISLARNGRMVRHLDDRRLGTLLRAMLTPGRAGRPSSRRLVPRAAADGTHRDTRAS